MTTATDRPSPRSAIARLAKASAIAALALCAGLAAGSAQARGCPPKIVVHPGDTLSAIASACGVSLHAMLRANPQVTHPSLIFAGEVLRVPAPRYRAARRISRHVHRSYRRVPRVHVHPVHPIAPYRW